jgi:putative transposase
MSTLTGGFYQRLTPMFAEYLCDLVDHGLDEVAVPDAIVPDLDRFRDVMIADGTVCGFSSQTSTKHATRGRLERSSSLPHNGTDQTIQDFSVTDEKSRDSTLFKRDHGWKDGLLSTI